MRAATAAGKAGSSGETHFRVEVVSDAFTGQNLVQRQRTIYKVGSKFSQLCCRLCCSVVTRDHLEEITCSCVLRVCMHQALITI
jgi:hypothetical protein